MNCKGPWEGTDGRGEVKRRSDVSDVSPYVSPRLALRLAFVSPYVSPSSRLTSRRCLLPAFLCAHVLKRDVWVRGSLSFVCFRARAKRNRQLAPARVKLEGSRCMLPGTPGKILRYVPLRCYFLHFEVTVN